MVEMTGEKSVAWVNATRYASVEDGVLSKLNLGSGVVGAWEE